MSVRNLCRCFPGGATWSVSGVAGATRASVIVFVGTRAPGFILCRASRCAISGSICRDVKLANLVVCLEVIPWAPLFGGEHFTTMYKRGSQFFHERRQNKPAPRDLIAYGAFTSVYDLARKIRRDRYEVAEI